LVQGDEFFNLFRAVCLDDRDVRALGAPDLVTRVFAKTGEELVFIRIQIQPQRRPRTCTVTAAPQTRPLGRHVQMHKSSF